MLNVPEVTPVQPSPEKEAAIPERGESANPIGMICNLTGGIAFREDRDKPHVPVLAAFGGGPLHVCRLHGSWNLHRAVAENADKLVRSIYELSCKSSAEGWDDLTFQFGSRSFLYADDFRIVGFAATPAEAKRRVTWFAEKYKKPAAPSTEGGSFHLINTGGPGIDCQSVPLPIETILSDEALSLRYGTGSAEWNDDFTRKLRTRNHGLSILEGKPGTGKTFYLRHLMGVLKESHRFYFIPTSRLGILSQPEFIDFWARQRRIFSDDKFVVILEDSDAALMRRSADNRDEVSALLNLSDGMLADFLRLQIICTINCTAADIDRALLRPGRLLCHRVFGRLEYPEACRLAESLGRKIPVSRDYSLAEVFAGDGIEEIDRPRIGFAA